MPQASPPGYIVDYGGAGAIVVLIGDIVGGHSSWSQHAAELVERWHVLAISPTVVSAAERHLRPTKLWSLRDEAAVLAVALEESGFSRVHVGGWSLGGAIALDFALSHPERVASLILVEPPSWWLLRRLGRNLAELAQAEECFRPFAGRMPNAALVGSFLKQVGALAPRERPEDSKVWPLAWAHRQAIPFSWRVIHHDDDPMRLRRLTMPVLLICGHDSALLDRAIFRALKEHIPTAQTLELPGGHTSHMTNRDQAMIAFQQFLLASERAGPTL